METKEFLLTDQKYQRIRDAYTTLLRGFFEKYREEGWTIRQIVPKTASFRNSPEIPGMLGITEAEFEEFCWRRDQEIIAEIIAG